MNITQLQNLIDLKEFHHATYRNLGTIWEGLHIYCKDSKGYKGYTHCGAFLKTSPELEIAEELVKRFGTSLGGFGKG